MMFTCQQGGCVAREYRGLHAAGRGRHHRVREAARHPRGLGVRHARTHPVLRARPARPADRVLR